MVDQAQWCRALNHHTRDPSSSQAHDRKTESDMDPGTLTSKDLLAVIAQHESYFQLQKAVLSHQEALMTKHSQLLADMLGSIHQLFERLHLPLFHPRVATGLLQLRSLDYHLPNPLLGILIPARVFSPA